MTNISEELKMIFGVRLYENEPLAKHTNFRVGGAAKWFCEVDTVTELQRALGVLAGQVAFMILGSGSNVLFGDDGFPGVVFKITMNGIKIEGKKVVADAGVLAVILARTTVGAGLSGLEWAVSLPGTVGGMVRGNAGCFGGETKDNLVSIEVLRNGVVVTVSGADLKFGYRHSIIKESRDIVLSATFKLRLEDKEVLKKQLNEILEKRKSSQPLASGTAGCTFKNYELTSSDNVRSLHERGVPAEMLSARRLSAGWLIDAAGLKRRKIGGARVSESHANFIINDGTATASDIVQLISFIKTRVRDMFDIQLHEEIQLIEI